MVLSAVTERPSQIKVFEILAFVSVLLAQFTSMRAQSYSTWDVIFGAVFLVSAVMASRFRSRVGRAVWSVMMILFLMMIVGGAVYVFINDVTLPPFSVSDIMLSIVATICNLTAAIFLWSAPSSKWLSRSDD